MVYVHGLSARNFNDYGLACPFLYNLYVIDIGLFDQVRAVEIVVGGHDHVFATVAFEVVLFHDVLYYFGFGAVVHINDVVFVDVGYMLEQLGYGLEGVFTLAANLE